MPRVLVVDDDSQLATFWAERLERAGFETRAVFDPLDALAHAPGFAPDLALLDIGLPGMDGHELGSRLREIDASLSLIAITGDDNARKGERSDALGFDAHLVKPVRIFDLERMIRVVMTRRDARL
jgi:CheY-like chemotaxis protein